MPNDPRRLTHLAPSEWQIFHAIAKHGDQITLRELGTRLANLDPGFSLAYSSLHTLVNRLIEKGYVESRSTGSGVTNTRLYWPVVPYEAALERHVERFLDQFVFDDPRDLEAVRDAVDGRLAELRPARQVSDPQA